MPLDDGMPSFSVYNARLFGTVCSGHTHKVTEAYSERDLMDNVYIVFLVRPNDQ